MGGMPAVPAFLINPKSKLFGLYLTSGLHASLRSTLARIKVFFPPYMPPEKM